MALYAPFVQQAIGTVLCVEIAAVEPHLQRPDPGVAQQLGRLCDVLVHALALAVELLPAESASAVTTRMETGEAGPRLDAELLWSTGQRVTVQLAAVGTPGRQVTVTGDVGSAHWSVAPGTAALSVVDATGRHQVPLGGSPALDSLCAQVAVGLQQGTATPFDGQRGLAVLRLAGQMLAAVPASQVAVCFNWDWLR